MSEKPIIFNSEMVRAILEGRKSQTRRPIKPQPPVNFSWLGWATSSTDKKLEGCACWNDGDLSIQEAHYARPLCQIGDILLVRETWNINPINELLDKNAPRYIYRADNEFNGGWKPSVHMPREAARIFLKVKDVRVERIQDITKEDARAEGLWPHGCSRNITGACPKDCTCLNPRERFIGLWDNIYLKRGLGWDVNPFCWVISFERVNI